MDIQSVLARIAAAPERTASPKADLEERWTEGTDCCFMFKLLRFVFDIHHSRIPDQSNLFGSHYTVAFMSQACLQNRHSEWGIPVSQYLAPYRPVPVFLSIWIDCSMTWDEQRKASFGLSSYLPGNSIWLIATNSFSHLFMLRKISEHSKE